MTIAGAVANALPSYDVGAELGRGSWGVVLKGHHRQLGRDVAIKQLPTEFASDPNVRKRFSNEARLLASLDHPHIVPIYDYIEREGLCLLVMEYLPKGTVWSHFTTTGITMETSCALTMATCAGLQFAHQRGVLHRDIKPENLMFSAGDTLKVTDFGIAKMLSGTHTMATRAGEVLGSPAYIAPEQATGQELGPATDVYATAVMLYELLSGRLPFPEDGDPLMVLYRHVHEEPTPVLSVAPNVPEPLAAVVMYGLANRVENRYQSAEAFGIAIGEAGTAVWGAGWTKRADIQLMGGGPIMAAAERTTAPVGYTAPGYSPPTQAAPGAGIAVGSVPPPQAQSGQPIQPHEALRASTGANLLAAGPSDLVSIEQVQASATKSPLIPALVAAGLLLMTLVIARLGVGNIPTGETKVTRPGVYVVSEQDPARPAPVEIDLSKDFLVVFNPAAEVQPLNSIPSNGAIPISEHEDSPLRQQRPGGGQPGGGQPGGGQPPVGSEPTGNNGPNGEPGGGRQRAVAPTEVHLVLSVPGLPEQTVKSTSISRSERGFVATMTPKSLEYMVAGQATARIQLIENGQLVNPRGISSEFSARPKRSSFLTVPGILSIAVLLFALAYLESIMRSMRRGRRKTGGVVGLTILGGIIGMDLLIFAWLIVPSQPFIWAYVACAVVGAAAGAALGVAMARVGATRRSGLA